MRAIATVRTVREASIAQDAPRLSISLVGRLALRLDGRPLELRTRKAAAVLGYLALTEAKQESRERLVGLLWSFADDSFLPHGSKLDGAPERQPVWLTAVDENPNGATVRFYVDGAAVGDIAGLERAIIIFDGADEAAITRAREDWKRLKAGGNTISYWQQNEDKRWVNRAGG